MRHGIPVNEPPDLKNIGKTSDMQKANPNSLNMSLMKDMK